MAYLFKITYYALISLFHSEKGIEGISGRFIVKYNDGRVSQRMYFSTALAYSRIFKSEVLIVKSKENEHDRK